MSDANDCPLAVRDFLAASADIANAVGNRIYPDVMPQGEHRDRINISEVSKNDENGLGGAIGIATSIITLDFWAEQKDARDRAKAAGEMIRNRIHGYRGPLNDSVEARECLIIRGPELAASTPTDGSDVHRRRASMDVQIIHTVTVPDFA